MVIFIYITLMYLQNFSPTPCVDQNHSCGFKANALRVKQNLGQVQFLGSPALGKLMPNLSKGLTELRLGSIPRITCFG